MVTRNIPYFLVYLGVYSLVNQLKIMQILVAADVDILLTSHRFQYACSTNYKCLAPVLK